MRGNAKKKKTENEPFFLTKFIDIHIYAIILTLLYSAENKEHKIHKNL